MVQSYISIYDYTYLFTYYHLLKFVMYEDPILFPRTHAQTLL